MPSSTADDQTATIRVKSRSGPKAVIPIWILDYDPTGAQLRFMIALWSFASSDTGEAWPTMATIAKRARISVRTAESATQWARRCWLIETDARNRADGSFAGWTYVVADGDPRTYGGPGPEQKQTKTKKTDDQGDVAGTPVDVPATNRHESDMGTPDGGPNVSENVQNSPSIDRVRRPAYLGTPAGVPIELTKGTNQKTSSSCTPDGAADASAGQPKEEDASQKQQKPDNTDTDPSVPAARSVLSRITSTLPTAQTMTGWQRGRLVGGVARLIRDGWSPQVLGARLGTGLGSAQSVYAVLSSRVGDLMAEPAPAPTIRAESGSAAKTAPSTGSAGGDSVPDWRRPREAQPLDDGTRAAAAAAIAAGMAKVAARQTRIAERRRVTQPDTALQQVV